MAYAGAALQQDVSASTASPRSHIAAGAIAGQIAGLIMAVVVMAVFTIFLGKGPLYPVQVIGSFIFGDAAIQGFNLPALLAGLVLHQAGPSLFWGVVFGGVLQSSLVADRSLEHPAQPAVVRVAREREAQAGHIAQEGGNRVALGFGRRRHEADRHCA
jgi:hypothetical protein